MNKRVTKMMLASLLVLSGCTAGKQEESSSAEEPQLISYSNISADAGFDTAYVYSETGYDHDLMAQHFGTGVALFSHANDLFDIYNDYEGVNNLKMINDNAGIAPVKVEPEIIDMLKTARVFYDLSGGEFDITIGALLKIWHEYRDKGIELNTAGQPAPVPTEEELKKVEACRGWDKIEINEEESTVYISDPCVSLDVGGIAKGYAAEEIGKALEQEDIVYATVNAGRNIRTIHSKADGTDWRIGIQNPSGEGSIAILSSPGSISVVTSGDYERFFVGEDGNSYHHIIDPSTLYPSTYYHSVTILTEDSAAADCLSTTLFTMTVADGMKVLSDYTELTGKKADAVWIMDPDRNQDADGVEAGPYFMVYSPGLEGHITW